MNIEIITERFHLRELRSEDATEKYLSWLNNDKAIKWITTASDTDSLLKLKSYIDIRIGRDDICFIGIFDKNTGNHIGNVKYEPIDVELGYAVLGVLIGDANFRGKGVFSEVFDASAKWLKQNFKINQILLGVEKENTSAVNAYMKSGFVIQNSPYIIHSKSSAITMVREI